MASLMLEVDAIHTFYGESHILQGVSLTVNEGEVVVLLGRNGAGKTTTMRSIMNLTPPRRGRISFVSREITGLPSYQIARLGLAFVPSGRRVFSSLNVEQNLRLAMRSNGGQGQMRTLEHVFRLFPKLAELRTRRAGFLSGGEQQMLKLGSALLANPKLLLLDEPSEGLSPAIVDSLGEWIRKLRDEGLSILLSEQNALFALRLADRGYILEKGRVQHQASAQELFDSNEVRTYLGVKFPQSD
jgi:branched-chain amino acid transport system ATP-binding protein